MSELGDRLRAAAGEVTAVAALIEVPAPTPEPEPAPVPSPLPVPAPGTFAAELAAALKAGRLYRLAGKVRLEQPVSVTIDTVLDDDAWGIDGNHGTIVCSGFTGPAITIHSRALVRGFRCVDLTLDRGGLKLSGDGNFYGAFLDKLWIEGVQGHGIHLEGAVFESQIFNSFIADCTGDGMRFEHNVAGRVCSAMHVEGVDSVQNGRGMAIERFARDVVLSGCYFRDNRGPGCVLSNGHDRQWTALGFENNGRADPSAPHILAANNLIIHGSAFHDAADTGRYAVGLHSVTSNPSALVDCRRTRGKGVNSAPMLQVVRGLNMGPN